MAIYLAESLLNLAALGLLHFPNKSNLLSLLLSLLYALYLTSTLIPIDCTPLRLIRIVTFLSNYNLNLKVPFTPLIP